ncbi:SWIM zinc finger family protein [Amycolatopsis pittospori]|uniref:SWIM zinc finger family protein n=1 Tax=Amycolatopsis pittospori TaxID=2749434 RepID=UPI0015F04F2F|nr:SWIM zinc finger family protein [Amycolatopsis pittospori]
MSTPDDRVRGFPAFGPQGGHGQFARSWWGRAWINAMEDTALDLRQLKQGRKYAAAGRVGPITVSPGRIGAVVDDQEGQYRTEVRLAELTDSEWESFLDRVASRAGHLAALLDRDMPHDLVEAADDAGVHLLPGIGDLDPDCDCPGWELPCRHAAALSFQASWLLDADPFVLLLMRGKGERELLDELQRRNAPRFVRTGDDDTPAERAYADEPAPLPDLDEFAPTGGPTVPGAPDIPAETFALLIGNASSTASALLSEQPKLTRKQDAVRIAAAHPDTAERLRTDERAVLAWRHGGRTGLEVLETSWTPPAQAMGRARAAFAEVVDEPGEGLDVERNHCTVHGTGVQVRLGKDGLWYPYRDQWPAGPPEADPGVLFAALLG